MARDRAKDAAIIKLALKRWKLSADAESEQRKRELADLEFEFDPWPKAAKTARQGMVVAGVPVPERPMLNIPMLDQPIQLVINQEKAAHLGIQVHAEDEQATEDEAEFLQGKIRHIETKSRAALARSWAFERTVRCGRGYYRIGKDYVRRYGTGPEVFDQELKVERVLNQFNVYDDPSALEPGRCDRRFLFEVFDYTHEQYLERWGQSELAGVMEDQRAGVDLSHAVATLSEMQSIGDAPEGWLSDDWVRVARYWEVTVERKAHTGPDGKTTRELETRQVIVRTINAVEVLDEEEWDGQYIPYVMTVGREHNINGKRFYEGIINKAKDAVRLVNYSASNAAETMAMQPRTPWIMAEGQEEGHEAEFIRSTVQPQAFVRYKPVTVNGEMAPTPQRNLQSPDLSGDIALLQQAKDFVHSSTFTFDASLGSLPQKDRSGKAILALQQQSDAGNSHYLDNLAEISITDEAKILLDLIPRVYDRPGRVTDIEKENGERERVMVNQPFFVDPRSKKLTPATDQAMAPQGAKVRHYQLRPDANYHVVISVGKSYQTRMQQGSDALGQLLQSDPSLMPVIGWRYFWYNDNIPGHREIAEDMKKLRPPQLQDEQGPDDPETLKQQLAQAQQQLEVMTQHVTELSDQVKSDAVKVQAQVEVKRIDAEARLMIAKLQSDTDIAVANIKAQIDMAAAQANARASAEQLTHEAIEAESSRQHDAAMAAMGHEQAMEAGERSHEQALAQGEQGQAHSLEQQAIAAASEPDGDEA